MVKTMKVLKQCESKSIRDSQKFARDLAQIFVENDVVLLEGNLGTGKTFLVKEICREWGVLDEPSSPSFAILYQYRGKKPVNHFDLYRIEHIHELDNLGWEEHLNRGAVTFIEWPALIEKQLSKYYKVELRFVNEHRLFILKQAV